MNTFRSQTYLPKNQRKKILLISDDLRMPSGVGTMSREIVLQTCQHYNWVQIAASIQHPESGRIVDISNDVALETSVPDPYVMLLPYNGYGDENLVRHYIKNENINAIMIFTDPRFFEWLFAMEHEIRQSVPIIYYNIWDNLPYPQYNKPFYESCDALFGISKQTVNINNVVLSEENCQFI